MHIIEQYKHQTLHIHNCLNFVWMLERWAVVHLFLCLQFLMVTLTTTKLPDPGKMSLICLLMSLLLSLPLLVCLFLNWLKIQWRTHSWHIWVAASANACFVFWQINASFTYPWTYPLVWGSNLNNDVISSRMIGELVCYQWTDVSTYRRSEKPA